MKIKTNPVSLGLKNEKLESVSGTFLIFREPRVTKATTFICQKRKLRRNYVAIGTRQNLRSAYARIGEARKERRGMGAGGGIRGGIGAGDRGTFW